MIAFWPALGVRFDIGKIESSVYGYECWKALWSAVDPAELAGAMLFEGDTAATLSGSENVFCVVFQHLDASVLENAKAKFAASPAVARIAAMPMFVEGDEVVREPLVDTGILDHAGNLGGRPGFNRDALKAARGA